MVLPFHFIISHGFLPVYEWFYRERRRMGVEKEILRPENGPKPWPGKSVTVHCIGCGKNEDLSQSMIPG
jgi:hypothetical protein